MSDNIYEVTKTPTTIIERFPIHCGNCVLHLSKLLLMRFVVFLYDFLIPDSFKFIYTGWSLLF